MSAGDDILLEVSFEAVVIHWRGPSPFFFVPIPAPQDVELRQVARSVTYGWGVVPVEARLGEIVFTTSLFPRKESYLLPLKDVVRRAAAVTAGERVRVIVRSPPL